MDQLPNPPPNTRWLTSLEIIKYGDSMVNTGMVLPVPTDKVGKPAGNPVFWGASNYLYYARNNTV